MIRSYKDTDFDDVFFLQKISYRYPCTEDALRSKLGRASCWVAEIGGQVIGAAIVLLMGWQDHIYIWSITVAPGQRNKGWGAALLREVARNYNELRLFVDTESPAKRLYEREGFEVERFMFNHYGQNEHAYLMVKQCGPGNNDKVNC